MLRMTWKVSACPKRICSPGIIGEGELRGQTANPGAPGKMAVKTVCVSSVICTAIILISSCIQDCIPQKTFKE